jgi:alpha-glucoside transport system substrate-binding protein
MQTTPTGHVFISYSHEDQSYARKLANDLHKRGFETWMDKRIESGDRWWATIDQAIQDSAAFVVVMTPESEATEWVEREILLAQREEKPIFPLLLRGGGFSLLVTTQYEDVTDGRMPPDDFYERLERAVRAPFEGSESARKKQADGAWTWQRLLLPLAMVGLLGLVLAIGVVVIGVIMSGPPGGGEPIPIPTSSVPAVEVEPEPTEVPSEPAAAGAMEEPAEVDFAVMPGGFLEQALNGDFAGTTVTVDGAFTDLDAVLFAQSMKAFEDATGITVNYIGDKEFEARTSIAVDAGDPPDIADFVGPRLLANFARQGHIVDPTTWISEDWLKQQYNQSWLDIGTVAGPDGQPMTGGVWHRFNGKSLVWYPKKAWDAAGYPIPQTWDELLALTQQIADNGDTAWCIGIQAGAATGWPATDWTEDLMLRTTSLENYDAWVAGELAFSSPEVKNAIELWSQIWFNPDYVYGGTQGIVSTYFGDAPAPMFEDPPKCWLHEQANFITRFFPEGVKAGVDYDFFYFPPVDEQYGKPFLVAGDIMSMFNDKPEARALMEYFTTPQSASGWLNNGGMLAAHLTATPDLYSVDPERGIAELVLGATSFRFDGSDLMPGEVGFGSFWSGMTDYVSGASDLDTVLADIDASWLQ